MSAWKPSGLGPVHHLQQLDHPPPAVHAAPADFAFGGEAFAVVFGDVAGLAERLGDAASVFPAGSLRPVGGAGRRVDADDAVRPHAQFAQLLADGAGFAAPGSRKLAALLRRSPSRSRRRSAAKPARRASRRPGCAGRSCRQAASGRRRWSRCWCGARRGTDRRRRSARHRPRPCAVRSSMVSRSIGGSESGPLPTRPGHMAL